MENHKSCGALGMRNLEAFNKTTLFLQAWKIQTNHPLLISLVFREKKKIGFKDV